MLPNQSRANESSVGAGQAADEGKNIGSTRSFKGPDAEATDNDFVVPGAGEAIPRMVSRFEIRRLLGDGGFGSVYLAYDPKLHREIALKIPRMASLTDVEKHKFLDEARHAAQLKHPHVITIYDVGDSAETGVYIVMEYVEGETLARRLSRGKLGVSEALRVCGQVADAMHHAHGRQIYHRDLKPANIMIDRAGNARVCDFGLALHEDEQHAHRGEVSGTRAYMSPEQMQGNAHFLDGRTDIWSLGVILYECLTGRRPFRGENRSEIREEILNRDPRPVRQIDDTIPAELDSLCRRALERNLADRIPTAGDFSQALRKIERNLRRRPMHRLLATCGIVALVAVAALTANAFYPRRVAPSGAGRSGLASPNFEIPPAPVGRAPEAGFQPARINLLSRAPQVVVFSADRDNHYSFREEKQQLLVASRSWSVFACGSHPQEFWFDVAVSHSQPPGTAGAFWGLHPEPAPDGTTQNSCLVALIKPESEGPDNARFRLCRFTIARDASGTPEIQNHEITRTTLRVDWAVPVDLKLHINDGRLMELKVQGSAAAIPIAAKVDEHAFATGQCGLVGSVRQVIFTRALLETYRKE